jgi:hypothetical protein
MRLFVLALCAVGLAACSTAKEPETPPVRPTVSNAQPLAGVAVDQSPDWGGVPTPEMELDETLRARLQTVRVPVLLPRNPDRREDVFVTQGPTWASVSMKGDGLHLSVLARTRAEVRPRLAAEVPACDGECVRTARSHTITSVSFQRYGVSYLLNVECDRAGADPRCTSEAFALEVYEDLGLAGGAR